MRKLLKRAGHTILFLFVLLNVMAAFHAYKFTHFYEPVADSSHFDASKTGFLGKVKALMFGVKSYRMRIGSYPSFPFETDTLHTSDGLQLEAWESQHRITDSVNAGTIIMFHGHGGNKAGILKEAEAFYHLGYRVLLVDFRAHGNSSGEVCTIGYDEAKDVKAAYDHIVSQGETKIIFWGISLGAAAEMKAVRDYKITPSKMILEMPFGSLLEAVKARCRIMAVPQQPVATLLTFWGGTEQGFWAFDHNPEDYAQAISCPVLLQRGALDNRVSEEETAGIFRNIRSSSKQEIIYAKSGHQSLCANENQNWVENVSRFLKE